MIVLFLCMLVVLALLLLRAKASILMAEANGPLPKKGKLRRYLTAVLIWLVITTGVMIFALTR